MQDKPRDLMVGEEEKLTISICKEGKNCPYLNGGSLFQVVAEKDYWQEIAEKRERVMTLAEKEILKLREENHLLKEKIKSVQQELNQAHQKPFKREQKKEEDKPDKKRGAPVGHRGKGRKKPEKIDQYIDIWPTECDKCGCENITVYPQSFEEHIVQDIQVRVVNTSYRFHYGYCLKCKKTIYPKRKAAIIPKSRIGANARAVSGYLRYIGIPYRKTKKIFENIFGLEITHPSLLNFDTKMAKNGEPLYEKIKNRIRHSHWVCADETGWKVNNENWQLWDFINKEAALYRIKKSRGADIVKDTLGEKYGGFLSSDFYSSYNSIEALGKQKCIVHLLREVKEIEEKSKFAVKSRESLFCENLKTVFKEALEAWNRFHAGKETEENLEELKKFKNITAQKITDILLYPSENKDIQRIKKRIIKHNNELLTFLEHPEVEPTNNRAERGLRPSVIMRKIMFGNRSEVGAKNHAIIMSIVQTGILNNKQTLDLFLSLATNPQKIRAP